MNAEPMLPGTEAGGRPPGAIVMPCCGNWLLNVGVHHCTFCHHAFVGVAAYRCHRKAGECYPPREVGLIPALKAFPAWMKGPR
ncbi:hypothetical protein SEA_ALEEMILY_50 [Gordonia phage Aleemily]|uniref:Phage FDXHR zinc binding domain-containing protein n=1 Tax=Gordonia phage Aleemily TaxID=2965181 RepID=A0A9E7QDI0_9CAUD|nr:hypothetical protein SEA_ALEEMILY_50 [Gordonia phage Aleemily]